MSIMLRLLLSASAATAAMAGGITVGSVRVSALSPTVVRLEPRGPRGEDGESLPCALCAVCCVLCAVCCVLCAVCCVLL